MCSLELIRKLKQNRNTMSPGKVSSYLLLHLLKRLKLLKRLNCINMLIYEMYCHDKEVMVRTKVGSNVG